MSWAIDRTLNRESLFSKGEHRRFAVRNPVKIATTKNARQRSEALSSNVRISAFDGKYIRWSKLSDRRECLIERNRDDQKICGKAMCRRASSEGHNRRGHYREGDHFHFSQRSTGGDCGQSRYEVPG
jgi:hypothetical protein